MQMCLISLSSHGMIQLINICDNFAIRPNKLTFLVLVSIPLKKWRCGANFLFLFFFKRGQIAGYSYAYKYVFNGV